MASTTPTTNKGCQRLYHQFQAASQHSSNLHRHRSVECEAVSRLETERNSYWPLPFRNVRSNLQQAIVSKKKVVADLDAESRRTWENNTRTHNQLQECLANSDNPVEVYSVNFEISLFGKKTA